jgi:hypothetical protein
LAFEIPIASPALRCGQRLEHLTRLLLAREDLGQLLPIKNGSMLAQPFRE